MIAYCGLYCGDCVMHKGTVADLARDLRKELRGARFDRMAKVLADTPYFKELKNYGTCYEVLGTFVKFRCGKVCQDGGGPPNCTIRKCCQNRGYAGCWECDDLETCEKFDFLRAVHGEACQKNLRRIRRKGPEAFVQGKRDWYVPERSRDE